MCLEKGALNFVGMELCYYCLLLYIVLPHIDRHYKQSTEWMAEEI